MWMDRGWRGYLPDAALAVAVAGCLLAAAHTGSVALDPLGYGLLLLGGLALVARRPAPAAVLLVTAGSLVGYQLLGYQDVVSGFPGLVVAMPVLLAMCSVVKADHRGLAATTGVVLVLGLLASNLGQAGEAVPEAMKSAALLAGWLAASAVLGEVSRQHLRHLAEQAAQAERSRQEAVRREAEQERLRIARDLHDSLTHLISIVKVHAGVAVHLARKRGEEVPEALLAIQDASGEAMRELRATLEVLRRDDETTSGGLARLSELVERASAAGLPATVEVTGQPRPLPADVDSAGYRIVQEALTNVARHAGPATVSVHIGYGPKALTVRVDDDGCARPDARPEPGVGLRGMRERVTAVGGRLRAAPRPEGGFQVAAELPLPAVPPVRALVPAGERV